MRNPIRRSLVTAGILSVAVTVPWTGGPLGPGTLRAEMADVEIRAFQQPYRPRRAPSPFRDRGSGRFFDFTDIFTGGRRRSLPPGAKFGDAQYELAPAKVSVSIAYAHRRQYANRGYQYFHHYPYNYFGHPYRSGFRISLTN